MKPFSLELEALTSPEIEALLAAGWTRVIVPLGATEQHGPGLPLSVDTWHGRATALRAAEMIGQTLVAPTLNLGYSPEHLGFAGTLSLRRETLTMILEDLVSSLAQSGFTFLYFWFGHGGDWAVAKDVLPSLNHRWPDCQVAFPKDITAYVAETWDAYPPSQGVPLEVAGSHAGEFEASLMLAIQSKLVRREKLALGDPRPLDEIGEQMMANGIASVSPNGVLGDQRAADATRGKRYLEELAKWLVEDFNRALASDA